MVLPGDPVLVKFAKACLASASTAKGPRRSREEARRRSRSPPAKRAMSAWLGAPGMRSASTSCVCVQGAPTSDQVDASSGAYNRLAHGSYATRIYGELVTSADMRYRDFDDVEVYNIAGNRVVFDDREERQWWLW
jgi:hypothetical protein